MKKKTHEEYVAELAIKNSTVNVVEKYIDTKTPILHHCLLHNVFWKTTPSRALLGCGCQECKKEKFRQSRTKSHEQYIKEVEIINPNVIVVEEYVDAKTPILHKCKIDGYEWSPYPDNILSGYGCPKCRDRKLHEQRAKTQQQYESEVFELHPTIKVRGHYINAEIEILHECLIDGHLWMAKPGNILHGKGCPKCAGNIKLTHNEYVERLNIINPNLVVLEQYIDMHTKILHKCLIDGYVWATRPECTLQGCGCPQCAGNRKKTQEDYVRELSVINPDLEVIEEYMGARTPILHRCKIDGYEWKVAPGNILTGQGCSVCQESSGERQIRQWLDKYCVEYKYQYKFEDCKDRKQLPFDFYLIDFNLCIEYDGIQHYKPVDFAGKGEEWAFEQLFNIQCRDSIKTEYCKDNNIRLLRIPYFENVNDILDGYLLNIVT